MWGGAGDKSKIITIKKKKIEKECNFPLAASLLKSTRSKTISKIAYYIIRWSLLPNKIRLLVDEKNPSPPKPSRIEPPCRGVGWVAVVHYQPSTLAPSTKRNLNACCEVAVVASWAPTWASISFVGGFSSLADPSKSIIKVDDVHHGTTCRAEVQFWVLPCWQPSVSLWLYNFVSSISLFVISYLHAIWAQPLVTSI